MSEGAIIAFGLMGWVGFIAMNIQFNRYKKITDDALDGWSDANADLSRAWDTIDRQDAIIRELRCGGDEWKEAK